MASVSEEVEIAAPPERVWAVLADPSQFSSWMDNHQGFVGDPPSAFGPGTSFAQRLKVMGMPAEVRWTVDGFEEPRRIVYRGVGPMGIGLTASYQVAAVDAGSTVAASYDFSGAAVFAVAGQLVREVGETLRTSLAALKSLIET